MSTLTAHTRASAAAEFRTQAAAARRIGRLRRAEFYNYLAAILTCCAEPATRIAANAPFYLDGDPTAVDNAMQVLAAIR